MKHHVRWSILIASTSYNSKITFPAVRVVHKWRRLDVSQICVIRYSLDRHPAHCGIDGSESLRAAYTTQTFRIALPVESLNFNTKANLEEKKR